MQQSQRWDGSSEHQENVGLYTIKTVISSHFLDNFDKFQLKFIHIALSVLQFMCDFTYCKPRGVCCPVFIVRETLKTPETVTHW